MKKRLLSIVLILAMVMNFGILPAFVIFNTVFFSTRFSSIKPLLIKSATTTLVFPVEYHKGGHRISP